MTRFSWHGSPAVRPDRPNLSTILENLLIGEYPNPEDVDWLRDEHGVTAVLSLQDDADLASKNLPLAVIEQAHAAAGLRFHHIPVPDGAMEILDARLPGIVALMAELFQAGERVYLHCNAGMNRAPTAAIAYLHVHNHLSLEAARDFVKARRPCVPYMRILQARYGA